MVRFEQQKYHFAKECTHKPTGFFNIPVNSIFNDSEKLKLIQSNILYAFPMGFGSNQFLVVDIANN